MSALPANRSRLVKMRITNFGCIGPQSLEVALDEIVCLVGANNSGKSTVLRAYEAAVSTAVLTPEDIHSNAGGQPASVELWVHIPAGAEQVSEAWKVPDKGLLLVRSKWEWPAAGGKPTRSTWDPTLGAYSAEAKASGLDNVFNSKLPKPFRIGSLSGPSDEHKRLIEIVLEPIKSRLAELMNDVASPLRAKIRECQVEAEKPVAEFRAMIEDAQAKVDKSYKRVFGSASVQINVSLGDMPVDPSAALAKSSRVDVVESQGTVRMSQQGTGSQRALFWSMLEVRSELNRLADERRRQDADRKKQDAAIKSGEKKLQTLKGKLGTLKTDEAKKKCEAEIAELEGELAASRSVVSSGTGVPVPPFLPGYMLLIDEPETALHPSAVRAAKEHLYSLATESGWQVMLSTHHPAFVDPLKDHTTIVRLDRTPSHAAPNVYRSDEVQFTGNQMENLKSLLAFDQSVSEMFFSSKVVIVEGDTEFASFTVAMDADPVAFPMETRPLVLRARGKWTIPLLVRMLAHFRLNCAVLHDVDAPRTSGGGKASGAYTANKKIVSAIDEARKSGIHVIHRCSVPDFERAHGMKLPEKDKPFEAWTEVRANADVLKSVRRVLDALTAPPDESAAAHDDDGRQFEVKCKAWVSANAMGQPEFNFDVT